MTIRRGADWGRLGTPPEGLVVATSDRAIADYLKSGVHSVAVSGGDMFATLGGVTPSLETPRLELPIDAMRIRYRSSLISEWKTEVCCSHCVLRSSDVRGGWLRGEAVVAMNAQYLGEWDVAPRGHPNDGRVEIIEVDRQMSVRQRMIARSRVKIGTHVPHPDISVKSVPEYAWNGTALMMWLDGVRVGLVQSVQIQVLRDFATLWI
ncbi:MAG: hypothetical protein WCG40_00570 [Actinomycetes bacterium]